MEVPVQECCPSGNLHGHNITRPKSCSELRLCHLLPALHSFLASGDQLINLGLRREVRRQNKLRVGNHFLDKAFWKQPQKTLAPSIAQRELALETPLEMGEGTMKPLLCCWLNQRYFSLNQLH